MFLLTLDGNMLSASQTEKETEVQGGEESCLRHPVVSVWAGVLLGLDARRRVGRQQWEHQREIPVRPDVRGGVASWAPPPHQLGSTEGRAPLGGSVRGPRPAWKMPMHGIRQPRRLWNKTGHLLCPPPPHKILIKLTGSSGHHQRLSFNSVLMLKPLK